MRRLRVLLTRPEFTGFSTVLFAALYFWPFVAFARPVRVVRYIFIVWMIQIAVCVLRSVLGIEEAESDAAAPDEPSENGGPP